MNKLADYFHNLNQLKRELALAAEETSSSDLEAIADRLEELATGLRGEIALLMGQTMLDASYDERWTAR